MKLLRNPGIVVIALVGVLLVARESLMLTWSLPPIPAQAPTSLTTPQRVSTLLLPVHFELSQLSAFVNDTVPTHREGRADSPETRPVVHFHGFGKKPTTTRESIAHVDWHFDRGPIEISGGNDHIVMSTSFSGGGRLVPPDLKGDLKGSITSETTLTIDNDYTFVPKVELDPHLDEVNIGFLNLTGLANDMVREAMAGAGPQLSQKIAQAAKLKDRAETAWQALPRNLLIPDTKDVWLTMFPEAVLLEGPHIDTQAITASLGVRVGMNCSIQPTPPPTPDVSQLPDSIGSIDDDHFRVVLPISMQLDELSKLISTSLKPHSNITVPKLGAVIVSDPCLFVQNGKIYVQASIEGRQGFWSRKLRGTIRCEGIPSLDGSPPTLSFRDLAFTAETRSVLLRTAKWLLDPVILKVLQDHATVDLSAQLARARQEANTLATRITLPAPLHLTMNVEQLEPVELRVSNTSLFTCVEASGKAVLTLQE